MEYFLFMLVGFLFLLKEIEIIKLEKRIATLEKHMLMTTEYIGFQKIIDNWLHNQAKINHMKKEMENNKKRLDKWK